MKNQIIAIALLTMSGLGQSPAMAQGMSGDGHSMHKDHKMDHSKMQTEQIETLAVINAVDIENHKINASHEPIPAISWPAMTMDFSVSETVDLAHLEVGSTVIIVLARGEDKIYAIQEIRTP